MESAQKLLVAAMNIIDEFQEIISETNDLKKHNKYDDVANENIDKSIDSSFDKFRKTVIENCLFLPQNIIDEIEAFYDIFFEDIDFKGDEEEIEKYFDQLLDKIESIAELIRTDLGVEKINIKLKKRLK